MILFNIVHKKKQVIQLIKLSSDNDSGLRYGFRAQISLPLTQR